MKQYSMSFVFALVLFLPGDNVWAVSLQQAASQVQAKHGGRVLGAHTKQIGGREVHVIKVLSQDGKRVKHYKVDSNSGRGKGK